MSEPIEPWDYQVCKASYGNRTDKVLECDRCPKHFCAKYVLTPINMCEPAIIWFCGDCYPAVKEIITEEQEIETRDLPKTSEKTLTKHRKT